MGPCKVDRSFGPSTIPFKNILLYLLRNLGWRFNSIDAKNHVEYVPSFLMGAPSPENINTRFHHYAACNDN
jgi:hypothetical protein